MRILVEPSDYRLLNRGDAASLLVGLGRLRSLWPAASIEVFTDDPIRLAAVAPEATPQPLAGHELWNSHPIVPRLLPSGRSTMLPSASLFIAAEIRTRWPEVATRRLETVLRRQSVARADLDAYVGAVATADLVVVTGMGGIADPFTRYARGVLGTVALAAHHGVPTAMMSQQIGPFSSHRLRHAAANVLPGVDLIALREARVGVPLLRRLGVVPDRVRVTGDDTVGYVYGLRGAAIGAGIGLNVRTSRYAGVDGSVAGQVGAAARAASEQLGAALLGLPVSQNPDEDDAGAIGRIMGAAPDAGYPATTDVRGFVELIQRCRIVVTGSYHGAVFALAQGVPAVCVSNAPYYDQKFQGLAALFGAGCDVVRVGPDLHRRLAQAIESAWRRAPDVRTGLLDAAADQIASADAAYAHLGTLVSPSTLGRPGGGVTNGGMARG